MRIWEHSNYRNYLSERLGGEGARTGLRKALAEAIPVHTTFVSQVLKGRAELSLEQAESVNTFLGHTDDEGEYFLLLLLWERAAHPHLKKRFAQKMQTMRAAHLEIKNRLEGHEEISTQDQERFYSSHLYGAIHVLSGIPEFQTVERLAEALKLSRPRTQELVDFLLRLKVLTEDNGRLKPGSQHLHLPGGSPLTLRHHINWRLHTVASLQFVNPDDLHYSGCVSLSQQDVIKVKEIILEALQRSVAVITASPEETAYVLAFDFYPLKS
ncbi:MAG: DUF4423 domain-containing protein [Bdellovibrionales bacterium]|nr:DUF4423 domain-containing protein [Bdellovibrionales bacterium]